MFKFDNFAMCKGMTYFRKCTVELHTIAQFSAQNLRAAPTFQTPQSVLCEEIEAPPFHRA